MCQRYRQRKKRHFRALGTGEEEWYTPQLYIDAARAVLGGIDLDPATSLRAQERIQAARFYTADNDGLNQEWHGQVWLNPPYRPPLMGRFIDKLIGEIRAGRVCEAILLSHSYTSSAWYHRAQAVVRAVLLPEGRIRFESPEGKLADPTQGQTFFYFGPHPERFKEVFGVFRGSIVQRMG